ncbi:RNA polymerase-associated protein RapA [Frondihabitans sp. 762G35]|uniref:SNF2-related protein n=1 Tax=Frondihabitans sp. 762G35 TaxID=1446794 RepID=UPI000D21EBB2|nr:DEAD/DEAH box helicase [Frondihabitans sp. 762G35]ARC56002.1 RNA polymerase-associated protein RapA [Frondihabitans sp. 762G35]
MTHTYGKYQYVANPENNYGQPLDYPEWHLELEPSVAIRAKRVFGRARSTIRGRVAMRATLEVARDIVWLMDRWPLVPADNESEETLRQEADAHTVREARIGDVLAGVQTRLDFHTEPTRPPREYQRTAVEMLRASRTLLLTDEVGLGKTYTGLLAATQRDALPALVVPPTHLPKRWMDEMQESFPFLTFELAKKTNPSDAFLAGQRPDVMVVPYSRLSGWSNALAGWARTVIFDEVQDLRNGVSTGKGSAAAHISREAAYVLGLTATPVYNYGGEIWEILNAMGTNALGSKDEFSREWGTSWNGHAAVTDPAALGSYLRGQGLMLGRTRKEVGRELPKTIKVPQFIDADPAALEAVAGDAAAMARLILSDTATRQEKFRAAGELDWKVREATGIAKAPYVAEFCRLILEAEQKLVLFGWHRAVYDVWNEMLAEYKPVMYTGTESANQKNAAQEAFVNGDSRILIMSLRSGAGVDGLQKASNVAVFGELDWSPQVHEQAIGRLRRDGMGDAPPVAYFLNSVEGSDPALMEALQVKRNQAEPLLTQDGKLLSNSTQDASRARTLAAHILTLSERRAAS